MSFYKDQLKNWLGEKNLNSNRILSIGCENNDLDYFHSVKYNDIMTMDVNKKFKPDFLCDINLDFNKGEIIKFYNIDSKHRINKFSDIFTFELWEFVWNPIQVLTHCHNLLNKKGRLWISSPFMYPEGKDDYLRYTTHFWKKILTQTGFKIVEYKERQLKNDEDFSLLFGKNGIRTENRNNKLMGHFIICEKI